MTAADGGIVRVACTPVRAAPDHRAEMVSQWLCGEAVDVLDRQDGWARSRGPDGYEGWCLQGALLGAGPGERDGWVTAADRYSLGVRLLGPEEGDPRQETETEDGGPGRGGPPPRFLPWGARAAPAPQGRVRLPGGWTLMVETSCRLPDAVALRALHPPRGSAVVATAGAWLGTPYLWGGRTPEGADCSGLAQAVYAAHGVRLPRDSRDQLAAGPGVPEAVREPGERRPGDLLFFGASATEVTHVALCVGGTRILHAAAARGAVAVDDLAELPEELAGLEERLVGATRPLAGGGRERS